MALEVQIGADIIDFKKKFDEVEDDIQKLANEKAIQIKLGMDTKEITAQIKDAKKYLADLKQTAKDTGVSFQKDFAPKVANGGNALMQFSRIAQDAPFGIMGIGNNITATVEAFGHLQRETGSAGAALKSVASSMLGSGGILLAVSLVTSGLTYMSQKGLTVGDVFNKLTGDFDEARRAMQELSVETAKNAQAQISSVGAYVSVAKNVNLSMEERLIAVKKLQDEYPAYFGNLTKEQILNGNVANTVRQVTAALIAKAKASALTDRIVKLAEEEEKIHNNINNALISQLKFYKLTKQEAFDAAIVLNRQLRGEIDLEKELTEGRANGLSKAEKTALAAYKYSQTLQDLGGELRNNIAQQDRLTNSLERSTAASIKLDAVKEKASKKTYDTPQVQGIDVAITQTGLDGLVSLSGMVVQIAKNVQGAEGTISTSLKSIPYYFQNMGVKSMQALIDFNASANSLIKGAVADTFVSFGESIGSALQNGTDIISSFGKSFLSIFGGLLSEFGKMLIKLGTGIVIADMALKSGNGYAAIAAGVALVAVASAFKSNSSKLSVSGSSSGASGGNYSTGGNYSSPVTSSASSGSSSSFNNTVVFEIAGTSLIGVLSNTMSKNKALGGNLGI